MSAILTIQGAQFEVPNNVLEKYDHFLTSDAPEGLRNTVRQTLLENLRNNFAPRVKEGLNGGDELDQEKQHELQQAFDQYAQSYEFGVRMATGAPSVRRDPIEKEMYKLAKSDLTARYRGVHKEPPPKDWLDEMIPQLVEKDQAGYAERARSIIRTKQAQSELVAQMGV